MQKPIVVREISLFEYSEFFKDSFSTLASFYAKKSASSEEGILFGAFWDGEPCGALSAGSSKKGIHSLFHFDTVKSYRKRGICAALLDFALSRFKASGVPMAETGVEFSAPFYTAVDSLLKKKGFKEIKTLTTVVNSYSEDGIAEFYDFKKKRWDKVEARLIARGYTAKSFAESGEGEIRMLEDEMGRAFPEHLSPFHPSAGILEDLSFIIFKDGAPIAYCAMTPFENIPQVSVVSSMASFSKANLNGAAMWALVKCIEEAILSEKFRKTIFTFESDNVEMANLKDGPPTRFTGTRSSVSQIYRLRLENWGETR
jgi:hypothetical protein